MYTLTDSAEGDCYLRVPPDPGIEAAALGASASAAPGTGESAAPGAGESALSVSLADPSGGPVLAHSSTVLPCPAAPSGLLSGLHLPSFSTNLRVTHCTCSRTGRHLATFTRRHGLSLYTLTTGSPPVSASGHVAASSPESAPCSCRPLTHETILLHHRLGHPSLPRLRGMASRTLGHERYFLLVVDDYSRYTTVFPLHSKGEVPEVLIDWIRGARRQLSERFGSDLPVLRLFSDRGGEFSSDLLRAFCRSEGIRQTFTLPASPQQNGIAERHIGMVMDVARTSMIHAAAPHFPWPFAVQYSAHQINLQPRVSLPETTPTLRWTGKVGNASAFRVWGSRAFVRDTSADKLSSRNVPCVFLGFPPDAFGWQFYHPTSRHVLSSQDVTFDESVSYYHPVPPQGPAFSGVSQVDLAEPVEVAVDSGAARDAQLAGAGTGGVEPRGAERERVGSGGAEPAGAGTGGAEPGRAEPERVEPGGAELGGTASWGAEPARAESTGSSSVPLRREPLSPQQLREWYTRRCRRATGAAGGDTGAGAPGGAAGAGAAGGAAGAGAAGGAAGARATGGAAGAGAAGGAAGAGAAGPGGARTGGTGPAGAGGAAGIGAAGTGAGGAAGVVAGDPGAKGTGAVSAVSGGAARPRPYYVPLLQQSRPVSPESRSESPVRTACAGRLVSRSRPSPVSGTHSMTLRPSTAPQRVPLPSPPASSLPYCPDPESDSLRAASPTVTRFLATTVTDPLFESTAASALVTKLVDFAAACRLDYATSLVAESSSSSVYPLFVGGKCALGTDVLEDRQEEFECFAAAVPCLVSMLLAPEGDPDAPDIPTPRSYAEAIEGPYSSQWQAAMDAEMASWKSTGTYVDEVPPPGANIVSGMWSFKVKRPPGSPPVFKARYVARGFSQRQGVDFFQTFSPTPKMTTLWVLLHVAAQRDYELHSHDFSTAFLQGSLHEEIRLRCPPGFTGLFPAGTQWSLRRRVYGLRQAPHDLVFATADTEALAHVKYELQKRHTCTDLGELTSYLGLRITRDRAQRTITLTQSHMVQQVLQRFGFTYSSPQSTPLPTGHSLSAPPSDESVEPSGPYPELVGCLMYLMTCTRPDLAYPLSLLARYVAPGRHGKVHWDAAKRVLRNLCSTSGMGLVLGGPARVVLTGYADVSWVDDLATQRTSQGYTFSLGSGSVSWRSTRSSSVLSTSCEAKIYARAMAAKELR
ncbi:unnamed protein product [Closterium sp. NIES-54]